MFTVHSTGFLLQNTQFLPVNTVASCFEGGVEKHFPEINKLLEEKYSD